MVEGIGMVEMGIGMLSFQTVRRSKSLVGRLWAVQQQYEVLGLNGKGWKWEISSSPLRKIEVSAEKRTSMGGVWLEIPKMKEALE